MRVSPLDAIGLFSLLDPGKLRGRYRTELPGHRLISCDSRVLEDLRLHTPRLRGDEAAINALDPPHTSGYPTVMENRKKGLTCRTWAIKVYQKLVEAGLIQREGSDEIEAFIKHKSIELEQMAAEGKLEMSETIMA
jgi:hypothetical protein